MLTLEGHKNLRLIELDVLTISAAAGDLIDSGLSAAYLDEPEEIIPCSFAITDHDTYGFELSAYDTTRTVVIDPLVYSTFLGGNIEDEVGDMFVDDVGQVYICGRTRSPDFPSTKGAYCTTFPGGYACGFVCKLSIDGKSLDYATFIGGRLEDWCNGIMVDNEGQACVIGRTRSKNFPTTQGAFQATSPDTQSNGDAFVFKLSDDGDSLVFSSFLGGEGYENGESIYVGKNGSLYLTGSTDSSNFPISPSAYQNRLASPERADMFYCMMSPDGEQLLYSTLLGGGDIDIGKDLAVDRAGNAYIIGGTYSQDFPTTKDAFQEAFGGYRTDVFACKFDAQGGLVYSTLLGGDGGDWGYGICVNESGQAYLAGTTNSTDFPFTLGDPKNPWRDTRDAFLVKLNQNGSSINFSRLLCNAPCYDIAFDTESNIYMTGVTSSEEFPITKGALKETKDLWNEDGYVMKLSPDGETILYSTYLGGTDEEECWAVQPSEHGRIIYVSGSTQSKDFPITPGAFQTVYSEEHFQEGEAFVMAFTTRVSTIVADAGPDQIVDQGDVVTFQGNGSREGDGDLNFTWTFNHNGTAVTMYNASFDFIFALVGEYRVLLSVTDNEGNLSMDYCTVTVRDIEPPVAMWKGNLTLNPGTIYLLDGRDSKDNVGIARFDWTVEFDGRTDFLQGVALNYTFAESTVYKVTLRVTDGAGNSNSTWGLVTTIKDTTPPTIGQPTGPSAELKEGSTVNITVNVTDDSTVSEVWLNLTLPDGTNRNYTMALLRDGLWGATIRLNQTGNYHYVIVAKDAEGNPQISTVFFFWVKKEKKGEEDSFNIWLIVPIALVLTLILLVVVMRGRGGQSD